MRTIILSTLVTFFIAYAVNAQDFGLLLGLRYGGNYNATAQLPDEEGPRQESSDDLPQNTAAYRTLWLRTQDGKLQVGAEKTSLLVPREDGFWRVDVKHSAYNDFHEDFIWINPPPDSDAPVNPFLANKEGIDAFDVAILVKKQGIETEHGESCTGHSYRDILFIENQYLSVGLLNNQTCRGTGDSTGQNALQILSLENLEPVDLGGTLSADNKLTFENTAKNYKDTHPGRGSQSWGDLSGAIVRGPGHWMMKGHYPGAKNDYTNFEVPIAVPSNLVKHDVLTPEWDLIKKQIPEAIDALSSPNQETLIILTKTSLLSFTVDKGKISSQPTLQLLLKHPMTIVMAQWAEGQFVDNWSQELDGLGPKPEKSWFTASQKSGDNAQQNNAQLLGIVVTEPNVALNIRESIGEHSKLFAKIDKGTKLHILDCLGQWYKVQLDNGQTGYALSNYVKLLPKLPYINTGCPKETCTYGKWKLKSPAMLYDKPSFDTASIAQVEAQQTVQAREGQLHTSQYGEITVVKNMEIKVLPLDVPVEKKETLKLISGDLLFDLEYQGQRVHVVWYQGKLYYLEEGWNPQTTPQADLWGKTVTERKSDWWVQVEIPDKNLHGWIANPNAENVK